VLSVLRGLSAAEGGGQRFGSDLCHRANAEAGCDYAQTKAMGEAGGVLEIQPDAVFCAPSIVFRARG